MIRRENIFRIALFIFFSINVGCATSRFQISNKMIWKQSLLLVQLDKISEENDKYTFSFFPLSAYTNWQPEIYDTKGNILIDTSNSRNSVMEFHDRILSKQITSGIANNLIELKPKHDELIPEEYFLYKSINLNKYTKGDILLIAYTIGKADTCQLIIESIINPKHIDLEKLTVLD